MAQTLPLRRPHCRAERPKKNAKEESRENKIRRRERLRIPIGLPDPKCCGKSSTAPKDEPQPEGDCLPFFPAGCYDCRQDGGTHLFDVGVIKPFRPRRKRCGEIVARQRLRIHGRPFLRNTGNLPAVTPILIRLRKSSLPRGDAETEIVKDIRRLPHKDNHDSHA